MRNLLVIPDVHSKLGVSHGDHKAKLRGLLLDKLFDDNVMELLLLMAQHATEVGGGQGAWIESFD